MVGQNLLSVCDVCFSKENLARIKEKNPAQALSELIRIFSEFAWVMFTPPFFFFLFFFFDTQLVAMNTPINRKPCVSLGETPQKGNFQISCMKPHCISLEFPLRFGYEIVRICVSKIKNGIEEKLMRFHKCHHHHSLNVVS